MFERLVEYSRSKLDHLQEKKAKLTEKLAAKASSIARVDQLLTPGARISSPKGTHYAVMQDDGNFAVYEAQSDQAIWVL